MIEAPLVAQVIPEVVLTGNIERSEPLKDCISCGLWVSPCLELVGE